MCLHILLNDTWTVVTSFECLIFCKKHGRQSNGIAAVRVPFNKFEVSVSNLGKRKRILVHFVSMVPYRDLANMYVCASMCR